MSQVQAAQVPFSIGKSALFGMVGADNVLGFDVVDRDRHRVGELRDIILDMRTGRIAYGIIALDPGLTGARTRLIAAPWNGLFPDAQNERFVINSHRDWIERAPAVQEDFSPHLLDREWGVFIHAYFGTKPYWEPSEHAGQQFS